MKSNEFITEGVDTSPEDVQQNHPDIYKFITDISGPYTIEKADVQSFDLGKKHFVVVKMGPTAGIRNTMSIFKDHNITFNFNETMNSMSGVHNGLPFTIVEDFVVGNKTQTWTFELAIKEESEQMVGEAGATNEQWGVFHTGSQHGQNNPATFAPVDGEILPSKDHAVAFAQRLRKEKIPGGKQYRGMGFSVRRIKPKDLAMLTMVEYNEENHKAGGSTANITGPGQVTVTSLDDGEDMFIGSFEDFQQWIGDYGHLDGDEWDDESADYDKNPDEDNDDDWTGSTLHGTFGEDEDELTYNDFPNTDDGDYGTMDDDEDGFKGYYHGRSDDGESIYGPKNMKVPKHGLNLNDDEELGKMTRNAGLGEAAPNLSPATQKYLDSQDGDVEAALDHASFMANIGRDPAWLPIIRELRTYQREGGLQEANESPEKKQINILSKQMREASRRGDEKAYRKAEAAMSAISDKLAAEQGLDVLEDGDWEDRGGGVKVKIGKSRPFKPSDMNTDPTDDERRGWSRKTSRNTDDGSRGLSARDRNR